MLVELLVTGDPTLRRELKRALARLRSDLRPSVTFSEGTRDRRPDGSRIRAGDFITGYAMLNYLSGNSYSRRDHRPRHRHCLDDHKAE